MTLVSLVVVKTCFYSPQMMLLFKLEYLPCGDPSRGRLVALYENYGRKKFYNIGRRILLGRRRRSADEPTLRRAVVDASEVADAVGGI